MSFARLTLLSSLCLLTGLLTACTSDEPTLLADPEAEGKERIAVLSQQDILTVDRDAKTIVISLPATKHNNSWDTQGDLPVAHPALDGLAEQISLAVGDGSGDGYRITSTPVILDEVIYTIDGEGSVSARKRENPKTALWETTLETPSTVAGVLGTKWVQRETKKPFFVW